jgi:antitoxin component YwqK of YwqJK toxin-antitoxin module
LKNLFFYFFCFISLSLFSQKKYQKEYYKNGQLKQEGWILNENKIDYWKFYYRNGNLKKEGHFKDNLETNYWYFYSGNSTIEKEGHFKKGNKSEWWLFYDKIGNVNHRCQLKDNQKNGYCLIYIDKKLVKASKFKRGKKIKEWTDFSSFRKENSLNDLR